MDRKPLASQAREGFFVITDGKDHARMRGSDGQGRLRTLVPRLMWSCIKVCSTRRDRLTYSVGLTFSRGQRIVVFHDGACSIAVNAPDCGSGYRGFESRQ